MNRIRYLFADRWRRVRVFDERGEREVLRCVLPTATARADDVYDFLRGRGVQCKWVAACDKSWLGSRVTYVGGPMTALHAIKRGLEAG